MIKNKISSLLKEKNIRITKVFEDTGIAQSTLHAMKKNTFKGIDYETLSKLCEYLKCEVGDILEYKGD